MIRGWLSDRFDRLKADLMKESRKRSVWNQLGLRIILRTLYRTKIRSRYYFYRRKTNALFVIATPRTGSSLFLTYLNSIPGFDLRGEILHVNAYNGLRRHHLSRQAVIRHIAYSLNTCRYQVSGAKFQLQQLRHHGISLRMLKSHFPTAKFVILYRESLLDQYVSKRIASITQEGSWSPSYRLPSGIHMDKNDFRHYCESIQNLYEEIFRDKDLKNHAIVIRYEDLADDAQRVFDQKVFPFLGIPSVAVSTSMRKLNTRRPVDMVENYEEMLPILKDPICRLKTPE